MGAALPALGARLPLGRGIEQHQVRLVSRGEAGKLESERGRPGAHPVDEDGQLEHPGQDQVGVQDAERRLQPGHPHRRLLERHLLLVHRMGRVVGGDAVDHAGAQTLDQRLAIVLGAKRRVHLEAGIEAPDRLVDQRQVVRGRLAADLRPRPAWPRRRPPPTPAPTGAGRGCGRPRRPRARRRGRSSSTRRPRGFRRGPGRPRPVPRAWRRRGAARARRRAGTDRGPLRGARSGRPPAAGTEARGAARAAFEIGRPSSENPAAPASRSSAISVSSSPSMPRVTQARNPAGTEASSAARSRRARMSAAVSTGGCVFAIARIPQ